MAGIFIRHKKGAAAPNFSSRVSQSSERQHRQRKRLRVRLELHFGLLIQALRIVQAGAARAGAAGLRTKFGERPPGCDCSVQVRFANGIANTQIHKNAEERWRVRIFKSKCESLSIAIRHAASLRLHIPHHTRAQHSRYSCDFSILM
jgi:hypothetical protein